MVNEIESDIENYPYLKSNLEEFEDIQKDRMRVVLENSLEDFKNEYYDNVESEEEAEEYIENYEVTLDELNELDFIIDDEVAIEIYRNLILPMWYDSWKAKGLEETIERNQKILNQLESILNYDLKKQFLIINIALNATHQTGDMMEYYEDAYRINKDDLNQLSNMNTEKWEKELKQLGF